MIPHDRLQKAAEWHVALDSDSLTEADVHKFHQWQSNPDNADAFREIEKTWGSFEVPAGKSGRLIIQGLLDDAQVDSRRRSVPDLLPVVSLLALSSVLVAVLAGYLTNARLLHPDFFLADYQAVAGDPSTTILQDGSQLRLRGLSAVDVLYSSDNRHIDLRLGELQVTVAHDPDRPLTVRAGNVTATAEGTKYSVQRRDDRVDVSVTESVVKVCHNIQQGQESKACIRVHAGEIVSIDGNGIGGVASLYHRINYDWESGFLMVPGQSASDVLEELKRHHKGFISYDAKALDAYLVSGRFPLSDIRKTLDLLAQSAPLSVHHSAPFIVHVEPKEDAVWN